MPDYHSKIPFYHVGVLGGEGAVWDVSRNYLGIECISQRKAPIMHDFEPKSFQISIVISNLRCGFPLGWGKVFIGSVKNLFQPNDLRQVEKLLFLVEIFVIGIDAQLIDWLLKTLQVPPEALVGDVQQLGGELGFQCIGIGAVRQGILGLLILLRLLCVIGGVLCQGAFELLKKLGAVGGCCFKIHCVCLFPLFFQNFPQNSV